MKERSFCSTMAFQGPHQLFSVMTPRPLPNPTHTFCLNPRVDWCLFYQWRCISEISNYYSFLWQIPLVTCIQQLPQLPFFHVNRIPFSITLQSMAMLFRVGRPCSGPRHRIGNLVFPSQGLVYEWVCDTMRWEGKSGKDLRGDFPLLLKEVGMLLFQLLVLL